jgi:hypothetical protein
VHGLDPEKREATVADPYLHAPYPASRCYTVDIDHLIGAIALGIVTFDAKMLVVSGPRSDSVINKSGPAADC